MVLSACVHDTDIVVGEFQSQLVINSIFEPGKTWSIALSNSKDITDNSTAIEEITDASVIIIESQSRKIKELEHSEKGIYRSSEPAELGMEYELEVAHPDYGVASAFTTVPSEIELTSIDTSIVELDGAKVLKVDFNIVDNEEEENFYVWDLVSSQEEEIDILPSEEAYLTSVDGNVEITSDRANVQQSKIFISDRDFNGTEYNTSFISFRNIENFQNGNPNNPNEQLDLKLRVLSVSEELYNYLKSVEESYRSQNINTSSVNPVEIDFNITNGLGIFGAYKQKLVDIE